MRIDVDGLVVYVPWISMYQWREEKKVVFILVLRIICLSLSHNSFIFSLTLDDF